MNPLVGVFFHWLGGLASASFYIPYRGVKKWSWETYWLVGGFFSWIIAPMVLATLLVPDLWGILAASPSRNLFFAAFFGALWGIGGLTFGLTMRYLGIGMGMAVALGYCAAFGTLIPPIFEGTFGGLVASLPGKVILLGVFACLAGIFLSGLAGRSKERELPEEQKRAAVAEFNFKKGILVATFSGILSACMSYGLASGAPIAAIANQKLAEAGGADLWQNLPVLVVVLWGGFLTNFIWCVILNIKNKSGSEYFSGQRDKRADSAEMAAGGHGPAGGIAAVVAPTGEKERIPMLRNYIFSALAGVTWYLQFFFYSMGETRMGSFKFSSWTMHMASIIIFSTLWGIALGEWKGSGKKTKRLVAAGLVVLVGSTIIVGYGNMLKVEAAPAGAQAPAGH
jgi:L-rhamnose-H+ transport protein